MTTSQTRRLNDIALTLLICFSLKIATTSFAEEINQVAAPAKGGSFWLLSHNASGKQYPPYPFDPYQGRLPVYEMKGFPGKFFIADSLEDQLAMKSKRHNEAMLKQAESEFSGFSMASMQGEGAASMMTLFTNEAESLFIDTTGSISNGILPSWRDVRTSPAPDGMALGILIQTNYPFEITRVEAEVVFDGEEHLAVTEFEAGFFRNTNQFQFGMYIEPEFIASDVRGALSKSLSDLGNGRWLLSVEIPTYAWGTNRLLTIRTVPDSHGAMAKMSFVTSTVVIPGVTAYSSDNTTTNMTQVSLPKMKIWRRMLSSTRSVSYDQYLTDLNLKWLPGYQIGTTTNLNEAWDWRTDELQNWRAIVDTRAGSQFFITRPDPTQ